MTTQMITRAAALNQILDANCAPYRIDCQEVGTQKAFALRSPVFNCSPVIYEDAITSYTDEQLIELMNDVFASCAGSIEAHQLISPSSLRDQVLPRLASLETLEELRTRDIAYVRYLDFAVTMYVPVRNLPNGGRGSIRITNKILDHVEITAAELLHCAVQNIEKTASIRSMNNVLIDLSECGSDAISDMPDLGLYIASTRDLAFGAGVILNERILEEIKHIFGEEYIVLPSSIHEVIICTKGCGDTSMLRAMVREINETQVLPEERLSNSVYIYKDGQLRIAE